MSESERNGVAATGEGAATTDNNVLTSDSHADFDGREKVNGTEEEKPVNNQDMEENDENKETMENENSDFLTKDVEESIDNKEIGSHSPVDDIIDRGGQECFADKEASVGVNQDMEGKEVITKSITENTTSREYEKEESSNISNIKQENSDVMEKETDIKNNRDEAISQITPEVMADSQQEVTEAEAESDSATEDISTEGQEGTSDGAVTHSFSFQLKKEDLSHGDTESESHTESKLVDNAQLQVAPPQPAKLKNRAKKLKDTKSKDTRDSDSSVASKKKRSKPLIKCKFAPGSLEYIENCLRGRIFSGWVEERRWVDNFGSYRDVVEVDEGETELNMQLNAIIRSIPGVQEGKKWINITAPTTNEPSYCLWTLLAEPPIPGHYWFLITGVATQPQFGLRITLRTIRSVHPQDFETAEARQKRKKQLMTSFDPSAEGVGQQLTEWWEQARQLNLALVWSAVSSTLTFSNIRDAVRFVVVLAITVAVGLVSLVREGHHVLLRFIREAGIFLRNITPFLQSVMGFVEKLIGGLYLLLAMVYRDFRRSPPSQPQQPFSRPPAIMGSMPPPYQQPPGPRVVKYVGPEQWVYKSQNNPNAN